MRRVLIIAYYFPPRPAVASLRPLGLAKYLPEFGWEAVILTAALPGKPDPHFKVIETQYHDCLGFAKRLLKLDSQAPLLTQVRNKLKIRSETSFLDFILAAAAGIIAYPDPQKGWQRFAIEAGRDILRQQNIHAMVSSSPPQTSHIIARKLKDEFQIPWVADFHDLWTQNYYYLYGPLRRVIERRLELSTLSTADALVTVSQPMADDLRSLHKRNDVYSILYGFDPAEVSATPVKLTAKFTITYTGILYPGKRSPEPLFAALHDLVTEGSINIGDIEVRFYGPETGWVDNQVERYGLKGIVHQFGIVPREIALSKQRESQLLLLPKWSDARRRGNFPGKVFEYLAAKRPILAVGGFPDVVDQLLVETNAGVSARIKEDMKAVLLRFYQQYKSTGAVSYTGNEAEISKYNHREVARKFASILDAITR